MAIGGCKCLYQPLIDAGLVPEQCVSIDIELRVNEIAKIYFECNASKEQLDVLMPLIPKAVEDGKAVVIDTTPEP